MFRKLLEEFDAFCKVASKEETESLAKEILEKKAFLGKLFMTNAKLNLGNPLGLGIGGAQLVSGAKPAEILRDSLIPGLPTLKGIGAEVKELKKNNRVTKDIFTPKAVRWKGNEYGE